MSNTYSKCMLCERRHKPGNCEVMQDLEEVEPDVKPHKVPVYEKRSHPLAKNSHYIGTKRDGYNFLIFMIFAVATFILAFLLLSFLL